MVRAQAASQAYIAVQFNMGQCCAAGSRTFVHADIYDQVAPAARPVSCMHRAACVHTKQPAYTLSSPRTQQISTLRDSMLRFKISELAGFAPERQCCTDSSCAAAHSLWRRR